jgi:hypothetical protein
MTKGMGFDIEVQAISKFMESKGASMVFQNPVDH